MKLVALKLYKNIFLCTKYFPENRDVFVWGYGILGKGPNLDQSFEPVLLPAPLFGRNEFNPDTAVTSVNCGLGSNAAIYFVKNLEANKRGQCTGPFFKSIFVLR